LQAYKTSTETLQKLLAHPTLQRDNIEATMSNIADVLADHVEIERAVDLGGLEVRQAAGVDDVDDDELEQELSALRHEHKQDHERQKLQAERLEQSVAPIGLPVIQPGSNSPVAMAE
jgi:charged multivesicular body protein 7